MTIDFNLDLEKNKLKLYHDSGEYYSEIIDKFIKARIIVDKYIGQLKKAVVIDIDETMISEYDFMVKYDFGWSDEVIEEAQTHIDYPPFECVPVFIDYCMDNKIEVCILSSRREKYKKYVLELLKNAGFTRYTILLLRPDDDKGTIQNYKIGQRKKITNSGYEIIVNIGDQPSDLDGGYATNIIKLPNPFYLIDSTI